MRRWLHADIAQRDGVCAGADAVSVSGTSSVTGSIARTDSRAKHGDRFTGHYSAERSRTDPATGNRDAGGLRACGRRDRAARQQQ